MPFRWLKFNSQVKPITEEVRTFLSDEDKKEDEVDYEHIILSKYLTSAGKYAYATLCAFTLRKLFYSDDDTNPTPMETVHFCTKAMNSIMDQLALPEYVKQAVLAVLCGKLEVEYMTLIAALSREKVLTGRLKLIIKDLLIVATINGDYDARWRILIRRLANMFGLARDMEQYEYDLANYILRSRYYSEEEKELIEKSKKYKKFKQYALVTVAAVGGGALFGLTGGMAAPVIVEGLAAVAGSSALATSAVTALSTTAGTAVVGSLFGTAGASVVGYKVRKRVSDLKDFEFGQLHEGGGKGNLPLRENMYLSSTIAISGWIEDSSDNNFSIRWRRLYISEEQYFLRYETEHLLQLGQTLKTLFRSVAQTAQTILAPAELSFLTKMFRGTNMVMGLFGLTSLIDLPWSVCCTRATLVGKELAEVLLAREYGQRPVTLIGYSIGARVIYYCLLEMFERMPYCWGIIEDVYLIGAPCPADPTRWKDFTGIVAGTITNAFSKSDSLLKFLYRTHSLLDGDAAGLKPIELTHKRLKNVDVSDIISDHREYHQKLDKVLQRMNVRLTDPDPSEQLTQRPHFPGPSTSSSYI